MADYRIAVVKNSDHPINTILVKCLRELKIEVDLFIPRGTKSFSFDWIKEYDFKGSINYPKIIDLDLLLDKYDIIISSDVYYPSTIQCYNYVKKTKKHLIITSEKYFYSRHFFYNILLRIFYFTIGRKILNDLKNTTIIVHTTKSLTFNSKHTNRKIHLIPPAIELSTNKKQQNYKHNKIKLLVTSRHIFARDIRGVILAFHKLKNKFGDKIELTIIGDGKYYEKNTQLAAKLKLDIIFQKSITHEKLTDSYSNFDIFVHPAKIEATGIAPLEAMATGLVVVTPFIGGLQDLIVTDFVENELKFKEAKSNKLRKIFGSTNNSISQVSIDVLKKYGVIYIDSSSAENYFKTLSYLVENFTIEEIQQMGLKTRKNIERKNNPKIVCKSLIKLIEELLMKK